MDRLFCKSIALKSIETKNDDGLMTFEGYGSIFGNVDSYDDVILRGAFSESLTKRTPKLLWQHRDDVPIGTITAAREDERGLYIAGKLSKTQKGMDAYELLKDGAITGLSIGYRVVDAERASDNGIRTIRKLDLYEISLVTFPANESAQVTGVKSTTPSIRDLEIALRDAGLGRKAAKAVLSGGYKAIERDAQADGQDLTGALQKLIANIKG